jgi:DNA-binding response OmpR family regulator
LDTRALRATVLGKNVHLNAKEYGILEYLLRNRGKVVSQEELLEHVWDEEIDSFTQTVRTNVKTLRKKVDPAKKLIKTYKGKGYVIE